MGDNGHSGDVSGPQHSPSQTPASFPCLIKHVGAVRHIALCSTHKDDAVHPAVRQDSVQVLELLIFSPKFYEGNPSLVL